MGFWRYSTNLNSLEPGALAEEQLMKVNAVTEIKNNSSQISSNNFNNNHDFTFYAALL